MYTSGYHEGYYYENGIAINETLADTDTMTEHLVGTATGNMTAPTATETIMTSITQTTIAIGKDNGDHFDNHGYRS